MKLPITPSEGVAFSRHFSTPSEGVWDACPRNRHQRSIFAVNVPITPSDTRSRGPRPQVLLTALPPLSFPEGADESDVSSAPSGFT